MNNTYKVLIEQTLEQYLTSIRHPKIKEALHYLFDQGGKLLRPTLLFACAEHFSLPIVDYRHLATALEMIHTYSLIHDDLPCMDDDDYRRGKLTLHKVYDEAFALLIGDILLSDAFKIAAFDQKGEKVLASLSHFIGSDGMAYGQIQDMEFEKKEKVQPEEIIHMYELKTGKLFAFALSCVPLSLNLNPEPFAELGYLCGICFQLKDDEEDSQNQQDEKKHTLIKDYSFAVHKHFLSEKQTLIQEKLTQLGISEDEYLYKIIQKIAF